MADGSDPGKRPWSDTDNEYLARRYPSACQEGRLPDLAAWMHRSVEALQAQAGRLGITASRRRWTEDMYALLDGRFGAAYASGEIPALAERLGRSVGAVMEKAQIRGLIKHNLTRKKRAVNSKRPSAGSAKANNWVDPIRYAWDAQNEARAKLGFPPFPFPPQLEIREKQQAAVASNARKRGGDLRFGREDSHPWGEAGPKGRRA